MALAEHLAVGDVGWTFLAPCCHVVGVHLVEFPNAGLVGIVAHGAIRAVAMSGDFCCFCLLYELGAFGAFFEYTDVQ